MKFFGSKRTRRRWPLDFWRPRHARDTTGAAHVAVPEVIVVPPTAVSSLCRPLSIATGLPFDASEPSSAEQAFLESLQPLPVAPARPRTARPRPNSLAHFSDITDGARRLYHRASMLINAPEAAPLDERPSTAGSETVRPSRPVSSWRKRASTLVNMSRPSSSMFMGFPAAPSAGADLSFGPGGDADPPSRSDTPNSLPGAAARAAAAAQNNRVALPRPVVVRGDSRADRDAESGIGIEVRGGADELADGEGNVGHSVTRADPMTYLPPEISSYVLTFLDHASLTRVERVSRRWQQSATSHHVWREVFRNEHRSAWLAAQSSSVTYDTTARGMGKPGPDQDWKKIFGIRKELRAKWERGNLAAAYVQGHTDSVYCVQFDDSKFITGSRDKTIRIWDMRTFHVTKILGNPAITGPQMAIVRAQHQASIGRGAAAAADQPLANVSVPVEAGTAQVSTAESMFHDASILCLQFDREILVTGSSDATCIVWSIVDDYRPVRRLRHHSLGVLDVCIDPKHIVTCSKDMTLCVWDRASGEMLRQMSGHRGPVNAIQMRGNLVVSTSGDALIKLWNIDSGKCVREFAGHERGLACVQFSEDSRLIVSGGNDHVIRIWDANTGECIRELHGHLDLVRSLHLDMANRRVVSGSYDQSVKVFDLDTGTLLIDFPKWTSSWILCAKADYRRILATSQCGRTFIMDFGKFVDGVDLLASSVGRLDLGPPAVF